MKYVGVKMRLDYAWGESGRATLLGSKRIYSSRLNCVNTVTFKWLLHVREPLTKYVLHIGLVYQWTALVARV